MLLDTDDMETIALVHHYVARLSLPTDHLQITTHRATFERWIGRRIGTVGGAYCFSPRLDRHLILINLPRINRDRPRSLEVVVAEELLHMRDRLDGDRRRHAKHGYDRIATRVASLTGASLDDVRGALIPPRRRAARYTYQCPGCRRQIARRVRGTWSCGTCAPRFDARFTLVLVSPEERAGGD